MVFSSSLFLFAFLPLTFILYNCVRGIKPKNYILTFASLIFYSFGRLDWLLILIASVICNYTAGLFMTKSQSVRKTALTLAICINLGLLCTFKYMNFFTETLNSLPFVNITPTNIALPIGISFFTFQGMSYVIDVYRTPTMRAKNFEKVLLYIIFFPQLVAGPIVKYSDIADQIDFRKHSSELTASGIKRFVAGLVKKLFFANTLGFVADSVYSASAFGLDFKLAWLGAVCYSLQIYYDFSAYSDMAIGLGKIFGFHINENFDHPYASGTVKEFWRRWHISLSSWFREYLYIPLGGNRRGKVRARINRIIVFFFTGMWHGANWTFIIWGLWHGFFLMAEDAVYRKIKIPSIIKRILTLLVVIIGFVIFRAGDIGQAFEMIGAMFTGFSSSVQNNALLCNLLTPRTVFMIIAGLIFSTPVVRTLSGWMNTKNISIPHTVKLIAVMLIFVLCVIRLAASSFNPFIYTQF